MLPAFTAYYRSYSFLTPLTMTATIFLVASGKGNTPDGRFLFWCASGTLGLYVLFLAALTVLQTSDGSKALLLARASVVVALVDVTVLVAVLVRPLWSRRKSL
jgi:hypothetical protein